MAPVEDVAAYVSGFIMTTGSQSIDLSSTKLRFTPDIQVQTRQVWFTKHV